MNVGADVCLILQVIKSESMNIDGGCFREKASLKLVGQGSSKTITVIFFMKLRTVEGLEWRQEAGLEKSTFRL